MDLLSRQIEAVEKTLERVIREYADNEEYYKWVESKCPLCRLDRDYTCISCPLPNGCITFAKEEGYKKSVVPLEDIAGFLQSLLISLETMK